MLFNSLGFILIFLPISVLGFHTLRRVSGAFTILFWMLGASLFFYGWWNPSYLVLLVGSIGFNYSLGQVISRYPKNAKFFLAAGVFSNLFVIGYFKYANFFLDSLNRIFFLDVSTLQIILPLGISFFTFQQIAFLVDTYHGKTRLCSWYHYSVFVLFFPQLIAGPIVHHSDIMPQLENIDKYRDWGKNISIGMTVFIIGLLKKAVIADGIAVHATSVFHAAGLGENLTFFEAWCGALAYTFQLYFDFSGYSEMAFGIAKLFGIALPINFDSPYKAHNIAIFWQRWHITLSQFLKHYLYIPLGGNRAGRLKRYRNLMLTMLLGGLWHGAGWMFVLWGGLHGLYLITFHLWQQLKSNLLPAPGPKLAALCKGAGILTTFICATTAWVLFRAENIDAAVAIYKGMLGYHGFSLPEQLGFLVEPLSRMFPGACFDAEGFGAFGKARASIKLAVLFFIIWCMPNTFEFITQTGLTVPTKESPEKLRGTFSRLTRWRPNPFWGFAFGFIFLYCLLSLTNVSEFLYFQF